MFKLFVSMVLSAMFFSTGNAADCLKGSDARGECTQYKHETGGSFFGNLFSFGGKSQFNPNFTSEEKNPSLASGKPTMPTVEKSKAFDQLSNDQKAAYKGYMDSMADLEKEQNEAINIANATALDVNSLVMKYNRVKASLQEETKTRANCLENPKGDKCSTVLVSGGEYGVRVENLRKERDDLNKKLQNAEDDYHNKLNNFKQKQAKGAEVMHLLESKIQTDEAEKIRNESIARQVKELRDEQMYRFKLAVGDSHVTKAFSDEKFKLFSVDERLDALEDELDHSDQAIYLQEKLSKLLVSDILCDTTANKCVNGKNTQVLSPGDMKEVFVINHNSEDAIKRSRLIHKGKSAK